MKRTMTFEEHQLMSLYNPGTREGLIDALYDMRQFLEEDETELRKPTDSSIHLLQKMDDEEFDALELFPDLDD